MSLEAAAHIGLGQDDGFAEEGAALGTADIEGIGQTAKISQGQVIFGCAQAIAHTGTVDEEIHVIFAADCGNGRQFRFRIERPIFRRKGNIDQRRPRQVFGFAGIIISLHFPFDLFSCNLAIMMGQGDDLVTGVFDGCTFVTVDMPRIGTDDAVTGAEEG